MRKALLTLSIATALASPSLRGATAYEALRVLGKQGGESLLDSVTEVRGSNGAPQPREWKIIVKDPAARGGAREYGVQGTKLLGQKSPTFQASGAPMNMNQLNLDSDGVHQLAETEAKKTGFAYDQANYALRAGARGGSPVWEIQLIDKQGGGIATLTVSASTGNIVSKEGLGGQRDTRPAERPPEERPPVRVARTEEPRGRGEYSESPRPGESFRNFSERVGNHMERRGRQVGDLFHNLFSKDKRNTAGPHGSSRTGEDRPPAREPNDTDYVRPSRVRD